MPPITFDGKSIMIAGRRLFIVGARFEYSLCPPSAWEDRLLALKQRGFNTILTSCPWFLHERTEGRFDFEGQLAVGRFLQLAHRHGLRVIAKIGPAIGQPFDGSGLPAWLGLETAAKTEAEVRLREDDPAFLKLVSRFYGRLSRAMVDWQADRDEGGPLIGVQIEDGWVCGSLQHGKAYLGELFRQARERGFAVPVLSANGFWQDLEEPIETWIGWRDLAADMRQVGHAQPTKPRIATLRRPPMDEGSVSSDEVATRIAEAVSAGAQPILDEAVEAIHTQAEAGLSAGGGPAAPAPSPAVLHRSGEAVAGSGPTKRIASFCSNFGVLLADQDPPRNQGAVLDLASSPSGSGPAIMGTRGSAGQVIWAFRGDGPEHATALLGSGVRVPIVFGDSHVSWFVVGAALGGRATLDYANVPPYAVVNEEMLVLHGAAKSPVFLSIDGAPAELIVPEGEAGGGAPLVVKHNHMTIVVCNQFQIDRSIVHDGAFFFGVERIGADGVLYAATGVATPLRIASSGETEAIKPRVPPRRRKRTLGAWEVFDEPDPRLLEHPRAVKVDGDLGLASVGAPYDYGWFAAEFTLNSTAKQKMRFLGGLPDAKVWLDGTQIEDASRGALSIQVAKRGSHVISLLARHGARCVDGAGGHVRDRPGALVRVKPLEGVRKNKRMIEPADPFKVRCFVRGAADGERTSEAAITMSFTHRRGSSVIVETTGPAGLLLLNGEGLAWHEGMGSRVVLKPGSTDGFKSGANTISFAPLESAAAHPSDATIRLFEVEQVLVAEDGWRFRRWEQPDPRVGAWGGLRLTGAMDSRPRWYRATVKMNRSSRWGRLDLCGLSRGRVWLDGVPLGAYSQSDPSAEASVVLPVPAPDTNAAGERTLLVFDEDGNDPSGVSFSS